MHVPVYSLLGAEGAVGRGQEAAREEGGEVEEDQVIGGEGEEEFVDVGGEGAEGEVGGEGGGRGG